MGKRYRVDKKRNVGTAIFILEGGKTEFDILEFVFTKILDYHLVELRRGNTEFLFRGKESNTKIIGLNLKGNFLYDINAEELNRLFFRIDSELNVKAEDSWIFYLYDRDVLSYQNKFDVREACVERYQKAMGGNEDGSQGQLLLSYPAIEGYLISCFRDLESEPKFKLGKDLKQYAAEHHCQKQMLRSEEQLVHAAYEMEAALGRLGCDACNDLDDLGETLRAAYDAEERVYQKEDAYPLLSLISLALLEMGVLVEDDEDGAENVT